MLVGPVRRFGVTPDHGRCIEGEITDHLGYEKHDPAGKNGGNSRNGKRSKTVLTDVGGGDGRAPRPRRLLRTEEREEVAEAPGVRPRAADSSEVVVRPSRRATSPCEVREEPARPVHVLGGVLMR
ncbi:transposase [Streptomyces parvulus]|uniref:transposase n=1 Tax=Streptomyces parvulus TaxID=146923 RepID=UPI0037F409C1